MRWRGALIGTTPRTFERLLPGGRAVDILFYVKAIF
jgi:hypothetical protein